MWRVDSYGRPERSYEDVVALCRSLEGRRQTDSANLSAVDADLADLLRHKLVRTEGMLAALAWVLDDTPIAPISRRRLPEPIDDELNLEQLLAEDLFQRLRAYPEDMDHEYAEAAYETIEWIRFQVAPSPADDDVDALLDAVVNDAIT